MVKDRARAARAEVARWRKKVADQGDQHLKSLAGELHTLAWQLGDAEEYEEACTVAAESIAIYRRLDHPSGWEGVQAHLPDWLSELGDEEAAVAAAREHVTVARRLSEADSHHTKKLGAALRGLGNHLANIGDKWSALAATEEAAHVYRTIGYRPNSGQIFELADTLIDLDQRRSSINDYRCAAVALAEAVEIYRNLVVEAPDRFEQPLASVLNDLGCDLGETGDYEAARDMLTESVAIYRRLADAEDYRDELALALRNLGSQLSAIGATEPALDATREAVAIYRTLDDYPLGHAAALDYLGKCLADTGEHAAALEVTTEAVARFRQLAQDDPMYAVDVAESLDNLGNRLAELGRPAEALAAAQESVAIYRRQSEPNRTDLGWALNHLVRRLLDTGDADAALKTAFEARDLWHELARRDRRAKLPGRAEALLGWADAMVRYQAGEGDTPGGNDLSDELTDALLAARDAAAAYRELVGRFPRRYAEPLARTEHLVDTLTPAHQKSRSAPTVRPIKPSR